MKAIPYRELTKSLAKISFLRRFFSDPNQPEFFRPSQSVFDYQMADLRKYAREYGTDVRRYPEFLESATPERMFSVLSLLCSWKYINRKPMSLIERHALALPGLFAEVNNGGFHQYFFNSAGDDWDALDWGFETSGDLKSLERFRKVLAIFPKGSPYRNRAFRWKQLEALGEKEHEVFEPHTKAFFEAPFPELEFSYRFIFSRIEEFHFTWPEL
ncbi:hypothetical protein Verru16b_03053 [Lacunisphaera limnophila]|uniref:DNA mimic protein DMP19 C-terminal domain-containing protein n=1 Tax=Lacunisphaera limnophila TaxID=1838286 RepID=A0A1D8AYI8_9BACT|nr:DUF4375 domain-containing protein [Lacunisphaera limnophila]AOS45962.1 hypothetical protein Verru16b_03053 [Lacunisphaera limnophila]